MLRRMPSVRRGAVDIVVVWYVATGRMPAPVSPAPGVGAALAVALGGNSPLVVFLGVTLFGGLLVILVVVFLPLSRVGGLGADGFVGGVSHV